MKKENNKSELWQVYTETKIQQKAAGYKAAMTRALSKATSKCEKVSITNEYKNKIDAMVKECREYNSKVKAHNAAVKANATRRAMKASNSSANSYCSCARVSVSKKRK